MYHPLALLGLLPTIVLRPVMVQQSSVDTPAPQHACLVSTGGKPATDSIAGRCGQFKVRRDSVTWGGRASTRAVVWVPVGIRGPLPTLIFSPGFGQAPGQYALLLESWARQGYVVVGIAHPVFADPNAVELYDAALVIARHLSSAIDHILRERERGSGPLAQVDARRIGVVGHSVGGAAAAQVCAWDARVRAGMDLDGTLFGPVLHTGMRQPFFLLRQRFEIGVGDHPRFLEHNDQANLHEDSVFAHTDTMYWLTVVGLEHMAFTDAANRPPGSDSARIAAGLQLGAERTREITTRYVVDFFDTYLSGGPRPASLGQSPFPGTMLRHKP